ncbi:MAG: YbaK/EbsC family protein [Desulfovermiculus sp.]|nr:YbaK/EbsC family protein [Desulfovermiculus sp.]
MTLEEHIQKILEEKSIHYEVFHHEPVYTNPTMAEALGVTEAETIKSLVVKTKEGTLAVAVMPGDAKLDWKRTAAGLGAKKVSFAKPDVVAKQVGCEVGCVPPFGHLSPLPVIMDPQLKSSSYLYFNPGMHDRSYKLRSKDLISACEPTFLPET